MAIASAIGGFITFIANHWMGKWHHSLQRTI
jgi:hypothetical protein